MSAVQEQTQLDLAALVSEHQANLWRFARFLGADASEADDLVQETFLAVARRPFEQRCRRSTAAYLRTVIRRQLLMFRRKQRRELDTVRLEAAEVVWSEIVDREESSDFLSALGACLEQLQGRARRAVDLVYRHGSSREEVARELAMKPEGIKTLLRRTRATLRDCIQRKANRD